MKALPVLLLLLASCMHQQMNKNHLSGVYTRSFRSEYAVGVDTLKLDEANKDSYRITKSSSYQRIINGKLHKSKEYHTEHWLGLFDKQNSILNIQPSGKVLSVDLDKQEIMMGNAIYQRVNTGE